MLIFQLESSQWGEGIYNSEYSYKVNFSVAFKNTGYKVIPTGSISGSDPVFNYATNVIYDSLSTSACYIRTSATNSPTPHYIAIGWA